jgi:hypothetical protein
MTDPFLLRKMVVRFLRTDRLELFEEAKEKDWRNNLRWLDRSGLAHCGLVWHYLTESEPHCNRDCWTTKGAWSECLDSLRKPRVR